MDTQQKHRQPFRLLISAGMVFFGILLVVNGVRGATDNVSRLYAPNGFIQIETVDTPALRTQGLSGRAELPDKEGMLFVFDQPSAGNCLWMKDMLIAIDMIWLDADKRVLNVAANVAPDTFPENFCPIGEAAYALEIRANRAAELGIEPSSQLRF